MGEKPPEVNLKSSPGELEEAMAFYLDKLKEEYILYQELFQHVQKERQIITLMNAEELDVIVRTKEALLEKALKIDGEIAGLRELWQEAKRLIRPDLSREIQRFLQDFSSFMKTLVDSQSENEKLFLAQNEKKEKEVGLLRKAKRASHAYFKEQAVSRSKTDFLG